MRLIPAIAMVGALVLSACAGDDGGTGTSSGEGLTVGGLDLAGDNASGDVITAQSFTDFDGGTGTFDRFVGKPLVVNFWASWCAPCIREMPDFEAVHQDLDADVTFVGVNVQDQAADAQDMVVKTGVTYALVRDPSGSLLRWIGGVGMPTTAFVDADGTVRNVISKALSETDLREQIEALG